MKKTIVLNGVKVEYTLEMKNVKNINIRLTPEKGLYVSAPYGIDPDLVEKVLKSKSEKILETLEKFKNIDPKGNIPPKQRSGKRKIVLNGKEYEYELIFKKIKRINLSISIRKGIRVSAPMSAKTELIEKFLKDNSDFIEKTIEKQKNLAEEMPKPKEFKNGEYIYFLGEKKTVSVVRSSTNSVQISNDVLYLYVTEPDNFLLRERLTENFLRDECEKKVVKMCKDLYPRFRKKGISFPKEIRFKKMVSCWGNCRPGRSLLTFSTYLVQLPEKCIEGVICHEFTHFLHADHSKAFYDQLTEFMPDWKVYDKIMKELQKEIIIRGSER